MQLQEERAVTDRLRAVQAELASASAALAEENSRLSQQASRLQSSNEELNSKVRHTACALPRQVPAQSLPAEPGGLPLQMESLSTEHTEEMAALRSAIVDAMNRFAGMTTAMPPKQAGRSISWPARMQPRTGSCGASLTQRQCNSCLQVGTLLWRG